MNYLSLFHYVEADANNAIMKKWAGLCEDQYGLVHDDLHMYPRSSIEPIDDAITHEMWDRMGVPQ